MITALMAAGMPMTAFAKTGLALGYGDRVGGRHCHGCGLRGAVLSGGTSMCKKAPANITKILTALVVVGTTVWMIRSHFPRCRLQRGRWQRKQERHRGGRHAFGARLSLPAADAFFQPGGECAGGACGRKPATVCEDDERGGGAWL